MRKYYLISNSTKKKEVGYYIQTKGLPPGYTVKWFENSNSMTKLSNNCFPEKIPDLIFELEDKAILTDVVSASNIRARGFLVDQPVKDVFNKHNLIEHRYYPALLLANNCKLDYYWFHPVKKDLKGVDFLNSKFIITDAAFTKIQNIDIASQEDYNAKKQEMRFKHIRAEKIQLTESCINESPDLFFFPLIHSNFFVSDILVDEIKEMGITGFSIEEQNIL